ncbi:hypothetical protein ScPMuIL_002476 [Solemya velum]
MGVCGIRTCLRFSSDTENMRVVWVLTIVLQALGGEVLAQCTAATPSATPKKMPSLPQSFQIHVECNMIDDNKTIDIMEYYDYSNRRGTIQEYDQGGYGQLWYNFNTMQLITYQPKQGCIVQPMSTATESAYFMGHNTAGGFKMFSPRGFMHMKGNETYIGRENIRGITVDHWKSCQHWTVFNATMDADWYFSASPDQWASAAISATPVRVHVKGHGWDPVKGLTKNFEHYYEFFEFHEQIDNRTVFEIPPGVVCPGMVSTRKMDVIVPNGISFVTEVVDNTLGDIRIIKEDYDFQSKVGRFMYKPINNKFKAPRFGTDMIAEIHDFNTGVAYVTDVKRGNCTAMPIELASFDAVHTDPSHIRMRTSRDFFFFGNRINVSYTGQRTVRNILCDCWIAQRTDFPSPGNVTTIWEWFYAVKDWKDDDSTVTHIPVQLRITFPQVMNGLSYESNVFEYKPRQPDLSSFDIGACYMNRNRRKFQFSIAGKYKRTIDADRSRFRTLVQKAIASQSLVNVLRVSNVQLFLQDDIKITFQMLDVAPVRGDVTGTQAEIPLDQAANRFLDSVNYDLFVIPLDSSFGSVKSIPAIKNSIVETTVRSAITTGYGPGAMAALGVTMPIAGVGIGALVAFFFFKCKWHADC